MKSIGNKMASKNRYDNLKLLLQSIDQDKISMKFADVEEVIGRKLPKSAYIRRQWWANNDNRHVQAKAWLDAGWHVKDVSLGEWVTFEKYP